jgi:hypoxanthine phosphoribosyltransferase
MRLDRPLRDYVVKVLFSEEQIRHRVAGLGAQISADYAGKDLVLVGILRGAVLFMGDLSRAVDIPHSWDLVEASSYGGGTTSRGHVQIRRDVSMDIADRHVIVIEDIYDTGLTLSTVCDLLKVHKPASVEICALLYKDLPTRKVNLPVKYVGFQCPNEFVVGYGLDYNELFRNLPLVGVLDPALYRGH